MWYKKSRIAGANRSVAPHSRQTFLERRGAKSAPAGMSNLAARQRSKTITRLPILERFRRAALEIDGKYHPRSIQEPVAQHDRDQSSSPDGQKFSQASPGHCIPRHPGTRKFYTACLNWCQATYKTRHASSFPIPTFIGKIRDFAEQTYAAKRSFHVGLSNRAQRNSRKN